jgi:crossover junction endodeoxyribonuclease RuvC
VGYGIVETGSFDPIPLAYGCIRTDPGHTQEQRLFSIHRGMFELYKKYSPSMMSIERLFFNQNITTAMRVSEARGVILLSAAQQGISITEYTPSQVKQSVTGNGKARKQDVQRMLKLIFSLEKIPRPDDAADALALALCLAQTIGG